jgi:cation transport regulator
LTFINKGLNRNDWASTKEATMSKILDLAISSAKVAAILSYRINADLPSPVRSHLPPRAQDIYREAFNHAFTSHAGEVRQEEIAHRTAWAVVKHSYVKMGDQWAPLHDRHSS